MKLRVKGNSLRLRISQSEMAKLKEVGSIEDTICFAVAPDAKLTYELRIVSATTDISVEYCSQHVAVLLSTHAVQRWSESNTVGVYGTSATNVGPLELSVEKDFACLDGDLPDEDAFPNPNAGMVC